MGLFGSSDPAKAEAKLLATEGKHEEITIKNAHKELEQAEKAAAAVSKGVDAQAKVHRKALEREQKFMERLKEAQAKHDEAYAEEQNELRELNNTKSKLAEMEEVVATKKTVIAKLTQKHSENNAARGLNSPSSPTTVSAPSSAIAASEEPNLASHTTGTNEGLTAGEGLNTHHGINKASDLPDTSAGFEQGNTLSGLEKGDHTGVAQDGAKVSESDRALGGMSDGNALNEMDTTPASAQHHINV